MILLILAEIIMCSRFIVSIYDAKNNNNKKRKKEKESCWVHSSSTMNAPNTSENTTYFLFSVSKQISLLWLWESHSLFRQFSRMDGRVLIRVKPLKIIMENQNSLGAKEGRLPLQVMSPPPLQNYTYKCAPEIARERESISTCQSFICP